MKVMTILGTRPEIIRLSRVMARLDATPGIEHVIVHTGQNYDYELNELFFEDLEVRAPDHYLDISRESLGRACGDILAKSEDILRAERPDAVVILGDTNSALAAVMAKRLHIPTFHMEAGNRSFDPNVPEEVNRRIVDHTADVNLVYTEHARRNLLAEGLPARRIHLTGSPMREVLEHQRPKIDASDATLQAGVEPGKFFLVSAHREENVDHPYRLERLLDALKAVHDTHGLPVIVSLHPRTRNRVEAAGLTEIDGISFQKPFGFSDYCRLQLDAACVLSDSGTITEESSLLGFPAVTIRDSMERPEGLDTGSITVTGLGRDDVLRGIETRMALGAMPAAPVDYQIDDCSLRAVNVIMSLAPRLNTWAGLYGFDDS